MEKILPKKRITTILFLIILFLYAIANMIKEIPILLETVQSMELDSADMAKSISSINTVIDENAAGKYRFIEAYGYVQNVLGKHEESNFEVVKDTEGKLHYTYFTNEINDTSELVKRMVRLRESIEDKECELLYVMPPDKYIRGYTRFPDGIPYHMANETADDFLNKLSQEGIESIDIREYLKDSGLKMSEIFYRTDHHWTIQAAFWASGVFFDQLNLKYGEQIDPEHYYSNPEHYNYIVYQDIFLGSMGRKVGKYYTGVDDFTLIYPRFSTSYTFETSISKELVFTGRFEEALIAMPVFRQTDTPYDIDLYGAYMYGNLAYLHIANQNKTEDDPNILYIKDSFAVPFAAFASLRCHSSYLIDPRYYKDSIEDFINQHEIDYVVVMYSAQNLTEEFFTFGMEQ